MCDLAQFSNIGSQLTYLLETSSVYTVVRYNETKFQLDTLFRQQVTDYQLNTTGNTTRHVFADQVTIFCLKVLNEVPGAYFGGFLGFRKPQIYILACSRSSYEE